LIWLAGASSLDVTGLARHGVLTVRFGEREQSIPYWDEVSNEQATSAVTVYWHDVSLATGRVARRAEIATSLGVFLADSAERPVAAAVRMLAGVCMEIRGGTEEFSKKFRGGPVERLEARPATGYPSSFESGRFIVGKLTRSAGRRWRARGKELRYFVALRPNRGASVTGPDRPDMAGFAEVPLPPGSKEMADPFLWEHGGRTYLFFEDFPAGASRARLSCAEVLAGGTCSESSVVLDRGYHLSFPCVTAANGELFLLPEAAAARQVDLYRFSRFPFDVELVATPVEGVCLVDTTPVLVDGRWYFFTTTGEPFMETFLFWADRLDGAWTPHPSNPVSSSARNTRSAGNLFWRNGRLYRPTQDCSVCYGYAINVNEVIRLTPTEFEERPVSYVPPTWAPGLEGTHTWNESSAYQVIDAQRYQS
jgi:hypothetical protein